MRRAYPEAGLAILSDPRTLVPRIFFLEAHGIFAESNHQIA
jgi:hypothetical protein